MNKYLIIINRISAFLLLLLILAYFISGYGMTKGIIDLKSATLLHKKYLPLPTIILLILHSFIGARIMLARKGLAKNRVINFLLILITLLVFSVLIYLELR